MKRYLCIVLAIACLLSFGLTGCGKTETTDDSAATNPSASATNPADTATKPADTATKPADTTTNPENTETEPVTTEPVTTEPAPTEPADPFKGETWNEDGVLKILCIGNSFSVDAMEYVYQIAQAAGVKNIKLGNLFKSGCALNTHVLNAEGDEPAYTYYTNDNGQWTSVKSYKMADAIKSENWDFISFQQASGKSTQANTYDDLDLLMPLVEEICTNPKVEFIWHMTWAYRGDSVSSKYENDQKVMYEYIVEAVQEKIVPHAKIKKIVPSGTSIQNARSSYLGDTLNRDEYHLSKVEGRMIAGIAMVATIVGIDFDTIDLSNVSNDAKFLQVALESVKNAMAKPFEITNSQYTK